MEIIFMKNNTSLIISNNLQIVNFREIRMGNIAPSLLYRSSHPIKDNKQEKVISLIAANLKIASVINLSDTMYEIKRKSFIAPWYNNLLRNGKLIALGMDFCTTSTNFKEKFKNALQFIIKTEGPWLIHCHAGIDRTGFICMVLESFMNAALDEVINDYLLSFNSIFETNIYESKKIDSSVAMNILSAISHSQALNHKNLQSTAETYLRNSIGMSDKEIELLRNKLSEKQKQENDI